MNFFNQLFALSEGLDVTLRIKEKNGRFTISVLPNVGAKDAKIMPTVITGTPDELDADFINTITPTLEKAKGLVVSTASNEPAGKDDDEEEESGSIKKAPSPAKKTAKAKHKADPPVVAKKPESNVQARSMFDQPVPAPAEVAPAAAEQEETSDESNSVTE